MTRIAVRSHSADAATTLAGHGIHPVLARILAARGVARPDELSTELTDLLPPAQLKGIDDAARYLADAIAAKKRLLIIADYDCDGATACAVGVRGLRMLGAQVSYIVPNRFEYGYGDGPDRPTGARSLEESAYLRVERWPGVEREFQRRDWTRVSDRSSADLFSPNLYGPPTVESRLRQQAYDDGSGVGPPGRSSPLSARGGWQYGS